MSDRGSGFGSFLLGIAVGAVVGFLFAPEAGDDTRRKLGKRLRNLRDAAEDKVDEVRGLLESDDADDDEEGEQDEEEEVSTREQLRRRLEAARRRRRREEAPARMEEEEEPLA
ncbi:MAG TPA: YtxH domain-containing protein [Gemmatimonadales bacterium]|jgi:gas vesicle protein|nr:YtxH domain-containing protein [Gemmatimonadales bacterium]